MQHRLYTSAISDAAVTFICPEDTEIVAIQWNIIYTSVADAGLGKAELSFSAVSQHTTNEVVNVVDQVCASFELTTSGAAPTHVNHYHTLPQGVKVEAGEKLYLHTTATNISANQVQCTIYTAARRDNKSSFRRR